MRKSLKGRARALFDADYYVRTYGAVGRTVDAFEHFMTTGWRLGYNPNAFFDTRHYLAVHSDVAETGMNPLLHFALCGAAEARSSVPRPHSTVRQRILAVRAPSERAKHYGGARDGREPLTLEALLVLLRHTLADAEAGLIVSASHDRYNQVIGGVQLLVGDEEKAFCRRGFAYLHLAPAAPLPLLADGVAATAAYSITVNGADAGVVSFSILLAGLRQTSPLWPTSRLIVHHFMGHAPELLVEIAALCGPEPPIVWTHDFFTICPSYALLRNDAVFCGAPPPDSSVCGICVYGTDRRSHAPRIRAFFETVRPDVVAPSQAALDFWLARCGLPHRSARIIPLARLEWGTPEPSPVRRGDALRIAFVGSAIPSKGWEAFEWLAHRHYEDQRYAFWLFAASAVPVRGLQHVPVTVSSNDRDAMVGALAAAEIDVVVNWTQCHETFSYTTVEALAAGCFVLARRASGNVLRHLEAAGPRHGQVLDSDIELHALFASGEIEAMARPPRVRGRIWRGEGTADLLLPREAA